VPKITFYESTYRLEWMEVLGGIIAQAGKWLLETREQLQAGPRKTCQRVIAGALNLKLRFCWWGHSPVCLDGECGHRAGYRSPGRVSMAGATNRKQHCDFLVTPSLSLLKM